MYDIWIAIRELSFDLMLHGFYFIKALILMAGIVGIALVLVGIVALGIAYAVRGCRWIADRAHEIRDFYFPKKGTPAPGTRVQIRDHWENRHDFTD